MSFGSHDVRVAKQVKISKNVNKEMKTKHFDAILFYVRADSDDDVMSYTMQHATVRDVISDTHQLLLANWHRIKRGQMSHK